MFLARASTSVSKQFFDAIHHHIYNTKMVTYAIKMETEKRRSEIFLQKFWLLLLNSLIIKPKYMILKVFNIFQNASEVYQKEPREQLVPECLIDFQFYQYQCEVIFQIYIYFLQKNLSDELVSIILSWILYNRNISEYPILQDILIFKEFVTGDKTHVPIILLGFLDIQLHNDLIA